MQEAVRQLLELTPTLNSDLTEPKLGTAVRLLDNLRHPLSEADVEGLLTLLPADGDPAMGLNWTILHAVEASPGWPIWSLLGDGKNEWIETFTLRLSNAGISRP